MKEVLDLKDQITIFSRSNNDFLFERMKSFIPEGYNVIKCDQFNEWHEADDYLYHIIDTCPTKWAVNIDIDCFVYDWIHIENILSAMDWFPKTYCGMPDGGFHPQRNHSDLSMNPFFNIFNVEKIRNIKESRGVSWEQISKTQIEGENGEPFHAFFQWLYTHSEGLELHPEIEKDEITTHLSGKRPFLVHTWYSRFYGHDSEEGKYHTERIDYWYNEALKLKK